MKKRKTLDYFRGTFKLGVLSDVIEHWYELEALLGFQVVVSVHKKLILQYAHHIQTPPGFLIMERPRVIGTFIKNAHNYRKDYNIEVHNLGHQIMGWWGEICPPGGAPRIQFGGSTGVYTLIVLLSWWCRLLKVKPRGEHADCLRTLTDVDRVLLVAINAIPTTSPPPPSQPQKQPASPEMLPRKCTRSGRS